MASVVIRASRDRYLMEHWAEHPAESVLLSSVRIASNAAPCQRCRQPWQDFRSTSTVLSTTAPTEECLDLSATRHIAQGFSRRAKHKSRASRPPPADHILLHPQNRKRRAIVARVSPPVPSSPTSFRNADSPSGMP